MDQWPMDAPALWCNSYSNGCCRRSPRRMSTILLLAAIGTAHLLAVLSPGPSFLVVARTAMASSRAAGIWAALGMGVGSLIWAVAALFGLNLLFTLVPWLYMTSRRGALPHLHRRLNLAQRRDPHCRVCERLSAALRLCRFLFWPGALHSAFKPEGCRFLRFHPRRAASPESPYDHHCGGAGDRLLQ